MYIPSDNTIFQSFLLIPLLLKAQKARFSNFLNPRLQKQKTQTTNVTYSLCSCNQWLFRQFRKLR